MGAATGVWGAVLSRERGAGVGLVLIGFAEAGDGPFLDGLGVVSPEVGSPVGAGFALVAGSGEGAVLRPGFGDGAGLGLSEGFGLAGRSGLGAVLGFGLMDWCGLGLAVVWLGSAAEL
ncbi:hypothetical protein [Amycolatopsis sp. NPDC004079]|uniref:hypothetical protein n=1 Tax=Amycolatopsis sp. NPDC004079 TaxID=3154549 RepID=UPI0033BBCDCE